MYVKIPFLKIHIKMDFQSYGFWSISSKINNNVTYNVSTYGPYKWDSLAKLSYTRPIGFIIIIRRIEFRARTRFWLCIIFEIYTFILLVTFIHDPMVYEFNIGDIIQTFELKEINLYQNHLQIIIIMLLKNILLSNVFFLWSNHLVI